MVIDVEQQLREVRAQALALADRRVRAMQRQLREDGADDRAVLGIPDPPAPVSPLTAVIAWLGRIARAAVIGPRFF